MTQPEWSMLLHKSKENLEVATILYERGSYGLAAYHAQQSIETLFKSFVYQILRKHNEYSNVELYSHLPLKRVIGFVTNFVEKIEREMAQRKGHGRQEKSSKDLKAIVARSQSIRETFYKVKTIIDKLEGRNSDDTLKDDVWRYSMDLPIADDSEIHEIISAAREFCEERSQDRFMEEMIYLAQMVFSDTDSYQRTDNDKEYFEEIKPVIVNILTAEGFALVTLSKLLDGKTLDSSDRANMRDFVVIKGEWQALSVFFRTTGVLSAVLEVAKRRYPKTFEIMEKYFDLQRVSYASSLCATLILLYPHESYGRYPQNIMKMTTTEAIYSEKSTKVYKYIEECKKARDQIIALM